VKTANFLFSSLHNFTAKAKNTTKGCRTWCDECMTESCATINYLSLAPQYFWSHRRSNIPQNNKYTCQCFNFRSNWK